MRAEVGETHVCLLLLFFFSIEKVKTVNSIILWVVLTFLSVYSLAVVTLIVKKVTH